MKPFLISCTAVLFALNALAQHKTLDISHAELSYNSGTKKFKLSGISEGEDNEQMPDAFLRVLVQTGDGNYFIETIAHSEVTDGECDLPLRSTYSYPALESFDAQATLVKTYDKGGPRSRALALRIFPSIIGGSNPPATRKWPINFAVFDGVVVPGDVMTGIITIDCSKVSAPLSLNLLLDSLINFSNLRCPNAQIQQPVVSRQQTTDRVALNLSWLPRTGVVNIFFDLLPSQELSAYADGEPITCRVENAVNQTTLTLARSHDPNSLQLTRSMLARERNCSFEVQMENTGLADETDIAIGLIFSTDVIDASSLKISQARMRGKNVKYSIKQKPENMSDSRIAIEFRDDTLEGINQLHTGHLRTRGKVIFSFKLKDIPMDSPVTVQAIIMFRDANEAIRTKPVRFTRAELITFQRFRKGNCGLAIHCPVCLDSKTPPWLCQ